MKIINVIFLVTFCTALTVARVLPPEQQKPEEKAVTPDAEQENDQGSQQEDNVDESGSAIEMADAIGGSASGEEEFNDSPVQLPRPAQFPLTGFKGPVTITPMEPGINRQRPFKFRRPCFFCFPRGRLGRVEVTAPGGPFLMNNFGLVGYGMGYPNMGPPPMGPVGHPNMGFPEYGPYAEGPPCGDGPGEEPCNEQDNEPSDPMDFQEMSEEPPSHAKSAHKPMMHAGPKVMDHSPVKGVPPQMNSKPMDEHHKGKTPHNIGQVPMKSASDELAKKPVQQQPAQQQPAQQEAQPVQQQPAQQQPAQQENDKAQQAQQQQAQQASQLAQQQPAQQENDKAQPAQQQPQQQESYKAKPQQQPTKEELTNNSPTKV